MATQVFGHVFEIRVPRETLRMWMMVHEPGPVDPRILRDPAGTLEAILGAGGIPQAATDEARALAATLYPDV
jgi:hypothetical protein